MKEDKAIREAEAALDGMKIIVAPWTEEQVAILNKYQKGSFLHPFTCGSGKRTDAFHKDGEGILVATANGWICPFCNYTQDWAPKFLLNSIKYEELLKVRYSLDF